MFAIPPFRHGPVFEMSGQADAAEMARRGNRRKLAVFLIVFATTLLPGLAWNILRPAEYRANARLQITSGTIAPRIDEAAPTIAAAGQAGPHIDLLTQVQVLSSRSLLEEALRRLVKEGHGAAFSATDPVADLQKAVSVSPLAGTDIVELQAIGRSPQLLARIVNTLIDSYRDQLFSSHGSASRDALVNLRDEVERLGSSIAEKRGQLAAFRARSGVVSSERGENEALARSKGLSESLNKANEDAAKAEARLHALRESTASGKSPVHARDNPTQASIEQRLSATREQLRDMERTYTPDFMAMDPTARTLRARQAELERQLSENRSASLQGALSAAEEDLASSRATVERLRGQIASQRRETQVFSGNFQEAKALEDDLARLEGTRRNASDRLARLEASEGGRQPTLTLIEAASVPQSPWQPLYLRDALINLLASFLLGLLAMWFVELFNRSPAPATPAAVLIPQPWLTPALGMAGMEGVEGALPGPGRTLELARPTAPQLADQGCLPRELTQDEVTALLAGADSDGRLLCTLLLLGLTVDELRQLTRADIDLASLQLSVRGASARTLRLPDGLAQPLAKYASDDPGKALLRNALDQPLIESEINARLTCAALDAELEEAQSVSPAMLRHTCIAYLIRQNVRFSDLATLVGQLSSDELAAYAADNPGARRVGADEIDPIMPALRGSGAA